MQPASGESFTGHVVVTHARPQVSDLLYLFLLQNYGTEQIAPGISQGLQFAFTCDGGKALRDQAGNYVVDRLEAMGNQNMSFCGVGRGKHDEHGKDIIDCEATLLGVDLGLLREAAGDDDPRPSNPLSFTIRTRDGKRQKTFIVSDPNMRDLFKAVAEDDIKGSPPYSLGNLITVLYNSGHEVSEAIDFAFCAFRAAIAEGPFSKVVRRKAHTGAIALIRDVLSGMKSEYVPRAFWQVERFLGKHSGENPQFEPLNLIDSTALIMRAAGEEAARAWVLGMMRSELNEQHHFHTVTAEAATAAERRPVRIRIHDGRNERLEDRVIAIAKTNDHLVHKYLMAKDLGINAIAVIQQNERGQVQIFPGMYEWTDSNRSKPWSKPRTVRGPFIRPMEYLTAVVRHAERTMRNQEPISWENLVSQDGLKDDPWFFYAPRNANIAWLLNGSRTAPDVEPTKIPLDLIVDLTVEAFDDRASDVRRKKREDLKKNCR